jgi:murein DD-endopeptidase MepM/ murein hydrolase activator NlpD
MLWELAAKAGKSIATGKAQSDLGVQSPHLPSAVSRLGRFAYVASASWIGLTWYTAYANVHSDPGSGPTLVLPGLSSSVGSGMPSRSDPATPGFRGSAGGGSSGPLTTPLSANSGAVITGRPYGALTVERTDQGVDFGSAGKAPVGAIADGIVTRIGGWPGWPDAGGGNGIVYHTQYGNVYVMETFAALSGLKVGDSIKKGQVIGYSLGAIPGSTGIETGFANASSTGPLTPYAGAKDGTPMPGGLAFRKLLGYK